MNDAREWIDGLLRKFLRRIQPEAGQWPVAGTEDFADLRDDWIYAFNQRRVTEAEADEAIMRLRQRPPRFAGEHLRRFLEEVDGSRNDRGIAAAAADRDSAYAASLDCPYCAGKTPERPEYRGQPVGMVEVFDRLYDGRRVVYKGETLAGREVRRTWPMATAAHCTCALGRWMRQATCAETRSRIVDLADVLAGRSRFQLEDPTFDGTPAVAPSFRRSTESGGVRRLEPDPTLAPEPEPERIDA